MKLRSMNDNSILMKRIFFLLPALVSILFSCNKPTQYHRGMPYPDSDFIQSFEWTAEPHKYPGTGSDMHWWTWGADSALYVIDDDGANFGGPSNYAHLLKATGIPPNHKVETVTDFMDIPFRKMLPKKLVRRYVNGIIQVDSALYITIYDYDWNLDRNKNYFDSLYNRIQLYNSWQNIQDTIMQKNMWFTDNYSRHYGVAGIIKSTDFGKTWSNIPNSATPRFLGPDFAGLTFVNFGPGYTDVPEDLSPYVYALSNDISWATGDHVYLARVQKDSILFRQAWQFLSGISGNYEPSWSKSEEDHFPVFTDPGHVGHPTISYNKTLKRFILGIYSDVFPHKEDASEADWGKWDEASELQLYESENLWGPWKLFYNEVPWGGNDHTCYLPQIPNNWWSADGLQGAVLFSGDYTGRTPEYYAFMTHSFKLTLK